jgi:hypothetical protein
MGLLSSFWATVAEQNTFLQLFALLLFASLVPFFSVVSVLGIRRTALVRRDGLLSSFPALREAMHYKLYITSESRSVSAVKFSRYLLPIMFIFLTNIFMSMVLLDFNQMTNHAVSGNAQVFILCGGHCTDNSTAYQIQTFVAASYAFLGWMAWTFSTIFDRAGALQLFPSTFNRLLIRLVVAILVAIVARHVVDFSPSGALPAGSGASTSADVTSLAIPAMSFVIGMFPERGIAFITSKFEGWARSSNRSEDFEIELIEGISPGIRYRLVEIGIDNGASLAHANPFVIFDASLTPMSEVIDWIAQAQLLLLVKEDRLQTLQKAGYRTIFHLVRLIMQPNGKAALQTLCNWDTPQVYDVVAAVQAQCEYKRLLEVSVAIGSDPPVPPA